jgi:uncharacterized cofD-like protein
MRKFRWLLPGMGIKRWIMLCVLGISFLALGAFLFGTFNIGPENLVLRILGIIILLTGVYFLIVGVKELIRFIISVLLPQRESGLVDILYAKQHLSKGPNIVAIGGGTGLSVLLHGLKNYTSNISAIVTVADDGGSSGRLRKEFDMLPPGDIRDCLVALADTEPLMRDLFQFRFKKGSPLSGHNFGNLFITAMTKLTGDFEKAIKASSKVLAIRGQVIPSTLRKVTLVAKHINGNTTRGETKITESSQKIDEVFLEPKSCEATSEALKAIKEADAIILGPGSLFTSILPNLLIDDIKKAVRESMATKIYVCNVMTQSHETDAYSASQHVNAITKHAGDDVIDYVVVNKQKIPREFLEKYKKENAYPVKNDSNAIRDLGYTVIEENVINAIDHVRHNSDKLTKIIINLISDIKSFKDI